MKRDIEMLLLKLADGARILRFSEPESGLCLEKRLDPARFVRIHRSHLVNMDCVEAIEPYDNAQLLVRMKDGTKIIASRSASKRLRELSL